MSRNKRIYAAPSDAEEMPDEILDESEEDIVDEDDNASLKSYGIKTTNKAERQLQRYLAYIINNKKNMQAADAVSVDYDETVDSLVGSSGSLRFCDDEDLRKRGIRKIFLKRHDYVLLYKITEYDGNDVAIIEAVYHTLQDYENLFKREMAEEVEEQSDFCI